jgi:curved DNA-binding protein
MDVRDYYETLGVKRDASAQEIRSAYLRLARQYHPDVNPGNSEAEARFKEINEAHEVLCDPEKRKLYDELGPRCRDYARYRAAGGTASPEEFLRGAAAAGGGQGGRPYAYHSTSEDDLRDLFGVASSFADFFDQVFRGGQRGARAGRPRGPRAGQDIEQGIAITVEEAATGTTRVLEITDAQGTRRIDARTPAGMREGLRIRQVGQGGRDSNGGPNGDLYLVVHIQPDPLFALKGSDVFVTVPVPLYTCLLGGEVQVPTPQGTRLALTIPPETQNGRVFRLAGQGLPPLGRDERAGDLYATVRVVLPTHLSPEARDLVRRLAELGGAREEARS